MNSMCNLWCVEFNGCFLVVCCDFVSVVFSIKLIEICEMGMVDSRIIERE